MFVPESIRDTCILASTAAWLQGSQFEGDAGSVIGLNSSGLIRYIRSRDIQPFLGNNPDNMRAASLFARLRLLSVPIPRYSISSGTNCLNFREMRKVREQE